MYNFITSCVSAEGFDIEEMQLLSVDIDVCEFLRLAKKENFKDFFLEDLGYDEWSKSDGRSADELFEKDWSISCCKSFYKGCPSYYVVHSSIEYVYVNADSNPNEIDSGERNDMISDLSEEFYQIDNFNKDSVNAFFKKHEDELKEYKIPMRSLANENGNYNKDLHEILKNKDKKYIMQHKNKINRNKLNIS